MAIWNEKFYKGKDVYSDGSIEDVILDIVRRDDYKTRKTELIGDDFVLAYHLSSIRENILNWYPFSKNESAIEIGAGCGAITGMLCRKLGQVFLLTYQSDVLRLIMSGIKNMIIWRLLLAILMIWNLKNSMIMSY